MLTVADVTRADMGRPCRVTIGTGHVREGVLTFARYGGQGSVPHLREPDARFGSVLVPLFHQWRAGVEFLD